MGAVAIDSSVAIALLDSNESHHERSAAVLRDHIRSTLIMAASAYSETLVQPLIKGRDDAVEDFVASLGVEIVAADRRIGRRAAELRPAPRPATADALVLATAHAREAELLTFDDRLAQFAGEASQS